MGPRHTGKQQKSEDDSSARWILFFYSVPSRPVNARVKIWRRLAREGAVQLKGAVYVLPYSEERYEFCQWIMAEVAAMGGEGDFVVTNKFEMLGNNEIISLFVSQREADFRRIEKGLSGVEVRINSFKKGGTVKNTSELADELTGYLKEMDEIRKIDYFPSSLGSLVEKKIHDLRNDLERITLHGIREAPAVRSGHVLRMNGKDFIGRTWITRKSPFVDRMASAWLVRKFIDADAAFQFIDENAGESVPEGAVMFDTKYGDFTHKGELCTFEVLVRSFGIKDRTVKKIAEMVHELDVKDGRYSSQNARGVEEILVGIRKSSKYDTEILKKGMDVFEMLYTSMTG
ncbi:MAG: chromate resistance protein ChrB domain-containing protein [Nitrospirota bacterium]